MRALDTIPILNWPKPARNLNEKWISPLPKRQRTVWSTLIVGPHGPPDQGLDPCGLGPVWPTIQLTQNQPHEAFLWMLSILWTLIWSDFICFTTMYYIGFNNYAPVLLFHLFWVLKGVWEMVKLAPDIYYFHNWNIMHKSLSLRILQIISVADLGWKDQGRPKLKPMDFFFF